ncbi:hypothetical protein NKJ88_06265 [Mesorhizobium sp. M0016]|uniref:hypothetical protein n=1 Tax=Mesorhizobium sp. M0016 TaxID=2956843 RepID=UPI0033369DD1
MNIRFHPYKDELIFPDIDDGQRLEVHVSEIVCVDNGTSGVGGVMRPSVMLRIELADGKVGVAMTSARMLCMFAKMIEARHPTLFEDTKLRWRDHFAHLFTRWI